LWIVILDMLFVKYRYLTGKSLLPLTEVPYEPTRLNDKWVRD
jgi:hypothetical protein